jgi:hypothetical protein
MGSAIGQTDGCSRGKSCKTSTTPAGEAAEAGRLYVKHIRFVYRLHTFDRHCELRINRNKLGPSWEARLARKTSRRRGYPSARSKMEIRKVMRLEREVWKAAREKNAGNFAELVPADALMIFQSGILTQPDYIATMHGRTLEENTIEDLRGRMPNANTVILTYETVRAGNFEGQLFPSTRVIESTTWIRRGKRWVAILNQETPLKT